MGGEAVLDRETGLVWERSPSTDVDDWNSKLNLCERAVNTGGRFGWRLPSVHEFGTLLAPPAGLLPANHPFLNVLPSGTEEFFWTMSTSDGEPGYAEYVAINPEGSSDELGGGGTLKDGVAFRAWCVRGGAGYDGAVIPFTSP
jgi:hypothetical protein